MAVQPKIRITAIEYYQLPEYTQNELIQLIDGEVIVSVPPIPKHQAIVGEILFLFMTHAKQHGGKAFTAPIEVYFDEHNIYEPDVLYLIPDSTCKVQDKRLEGAPNLIVEVLSPSTAKFDRQEKYQVYEKHKVQEYWIVDPVHETLEVYNFHAGKFARHGAYAANDTFPSQILGISVVVKAIFG